MGVARCRLQKVVAFLKAVVSKCAQGTPRLSKNIPRIQEGKIILIIILRCYLLFLLYGYLHR